MNILILMRFITCNQLYGIIFLQYFKSQHRNEIVIFSVDLSRFSNCLLNIFVKGFSQVLIKIKCFKVKALYQALSSFYIKQRNRINWFLSAIKY